MEELLSQIWDAVGDVFGGMGRALERSLTSLFGSSNARYIQQDATDGRRHRGLGAEVPGHDRCRVEGADGQVSQAPRRRGDARRPAGRGLRRLPRGGPPQPGHAALRRPVDGRHRPAPREHRGNGHRRRQDPRGHPARLPQRPGRQGRARGDGERLPGPPRHGMDGAAVHVAGPDGERHPEPDGSGRAAEGLRLRHHLRHEQRVRLRLSPRQHAGRGPRRRPFRQAPAAGAGAVELCDHRRGGQHPHRRGPHAADHLRSGPRRRDPLRQGRSHRAAVEEGPALRGQGEGAHGPPHRRGRPRGRAVGGRGELLHGRPHGVAAPDRQQP